MVPIVEIFERFSDGSTLWRASVAGVPTARDTVMKFSTKTQNELYALNCQTGKIIARMKRDMANAASAR